MTYRSLALERSLDGQPIPFPHEAMYSTLCLGSSFPQSPITVDQASVLCSTLAHEVDRPSVLDLGAGYGYLAGAVYSSTSARRVRLVDLVVPYLNYGANSIGAEVACADARSELASLRNYDLVLAVGVSYAWGSPIDMLRAIASANHGDLVVFAGYPVARARRHVFGDGYVVHDSDSMVNAERSLGAVPIWSSNASRVGWNAYINGQVEVFGSLKPFVGAGYVGRRRDLVSRVRRIASSFDYRFALLRLNRS